MARTKEAEPKITYLNEPPKAEEIIKHLFIIYMRSQGIEVGEVEVMENTEARVEIIKRIIEKIIVIKEIDRLERIERYISYLYRKK